MPRVRVMPRSTVFGVYDGGTYARRRARHRSPAGAATASAAPAPVAHRGASAPCWPPAPSSGRSCSRGNDRPGIMLASAMRTYVNRYAAAPGRRVAVFTSGDDGWRTAIDLAARRRRGRGRDRQPPAACPPSCARACPACASCRAARWSATARRAHARQRHRAQRQPRPRRWSVDTLAVVGRLEPGRAPHLPPGRPSGMERDARRLRARHACRDGMTVAGAANGAMSLARCLADGARAGAAAADGDRSCAAAARAAARRRRGLRRSPRSGTSPARRPRRSSTCSTT